MKKNKYFEIGDVVNMHCGEQGIVVSIIDDDWVVLMQCDGHVEKALVNDIWKSNTKVNGKAELNSFFMKVFGYSGVYDEENTVENTVNLTDFQMSDYSEDKVPF